MFTIVAGISACLVAAGCAIKGPVAGSASPSNVGVTRSGSATSEHAADADGVTSSAPEPCPPRPPFSSMRYEEDWRSLADRRCDVDRLDRLKFIPLAGNASLSLGGDARIRYERFENTGLQP